MLAAAVCVPLATASAGGGYFGERPWDYETPNEKAVKISLKHLQLSKKRGDYKKGANQSSFSYYNQSVINIANQNNVTNGDGTVVVDQDNSGDQGGSNGILNP